MGCWLAGDMFLFCERPHGMETNSGVQGDSISLRRGGKESVGKPARSRWTASRGNVSNSRVRAHLGLGKEDQGEPLKRGPEPRNCCIMLLDSVPIIGALRWGSAALD